MAYFENLGLSVERWIWCCRAINCWQGFRGGNTNMRYDMVIQGTTNSNSRLLCVSTQVRLEFDPTLHASLYPRLKIHEMAPSPSLSKTVALLLFFLTPILIQDMCSVPAIGYLPLPSPMISFCNIGYDSTSFADVIPSMAYHTKMN